MFCIVSFSTTLHFVVLYCVVLYCILLYCISLCCIVFIYCIALYRVVFFWCIVYYHIFLLCFQLYCIVSYFAFFCYGAWFCIVLYYIAVLPCYCCCRMPENVSAVYRNSEVLYNSKNIIVFSRDEKRTSFECSQLAVTHTEIHIGIFTAQDCIKRN